MATALRFARFGTKKRPYYHLVATNSRYPRDSHFIEKLGTYDPLAPKENEKRFTCNNERVKYWLSTGAQPSDTVARFLRTAGLIDTKPAHNAKPKPARVMPRAQARLDAAKKAEEEAAAPKEAPAAEEAPAEAASA